MHTNDGTLILKEEVFEIVAAAMEVSNHLGCGFLEAVYQEAMGIELKERGSRTYRSLRSRYPTGVGLC